MRNRKFPLVWIVSGTVFPGRNVPISSIISARLKMPFAPCLPASGMGLAMGFIPPKRIPSVRRKLPGRSISRPFFLVLVKMNTIATSRLRLSFRGGRFIKSGLQRHFPVGGRCLRRSFLTRKFGRWGGGWPRKCTGRGRFLMRMWQKRMTIFLMARNFLHM